MSLKRSNSSKAAADTLPFTHLDKVFWPQEGYTKGDLIEYYRSIAPFLLPYLKDRPQVLHRFPNGIEKPGFYQKNITRGFPEWVSTTLVKHGEEDHRYLLIPDEKSLLFAINLGCIELNPFSSRIQHLNFPDYLILDLDPEDIPFQKVVEMAQAIHGFLESCDIPNYCKTSGATGLHIYVPLGAKYEFEQAKLFAQMIAEAMNEQLPEISSVIRSPKKRQHKVYIDFLQNNFGQTVAAPYSVRPRPGAPVSTPLNWSEVKQGLDPLQFTIKNMPERLSKKGDLFKPILGAGIDMKKCLKHHF